MGDIQLGLSSPGIWGWLLIGFIILIFILILFWLWSSNQPITGEIQQTQVISSKNPTSIEKQIATLTAELIDKTNKMATLSKQSLSAAKSAWDQIDLVGQSVNAINQTIPQVQQTFQTASTLAKSSMQQAQELADHVTNTANVLLTQIDQVVQQGTELAQSSVNQATQLSNQAINTARVYNDTVSKTVNQSMQIANSAIGTANGLIPTVNKISDQANKIVVQSTALAQNIAPTVTRITNLSNNATGVAIATAKTIAPKVQQAANSALNIINTTALPIVNGVIERTTKLTGTATDMAKNIIPMVNTTAIQAKATTDKAVALVQSRSPEIQAGIKNINDFAVSTINISRQLKETTKQTMAPIYNLITSLSGPIDQLLALSEGITGFTGNSPEGFVDPHLILDELQNQYISFLAEMSDRMQMQYINDCANSENMY